MNDFFFLVREIAKGSSVVRSTLDWRLKKVYLSGRILDLGSGEAGYYSELIPRGMNSQYELLEIKKGATVDFESDSLPYAEGTFDVIVFLNVLEHIFNYEHILTEILRIKKGEGTLVGYVPFLMWYHPDHHDYFRYTHETLERVLLNVGYTGVTIERIYRGPYLAAFQMIYPTIPRILRPLPFILFYLCDVLFRMLRKKNAERYVLGYYFEAK